MKIWFSYREGGKYVSTDGLFKEDVRYMHGFYIKKIDQLFVKKKRLRIKVRFYMK